jgi:hypothetical protein
LEEKQAREENSRRMREAATVERKRREEYEKIMITIHLLGLAPEGWVAAPDKRPNMRNGLRNEGESCRRKGRGASRLSMMMESDTNGT